MREPVHVAGAEHEAPPELEGIAAQARLLVARRAGPPARRGVVATQQVQERTAPKRGGAVGDAIGIHEQRKRDPGLIAKGAGVREVTEAHGREARSGPVELALMVAQLRDVLAAEDSTVVAQEDDHGRPGFPE